MSRARLLAVSYRLAGSFSRDFITIQSRSPRTSRTRRVDTVLRAAAIESAPSVSRKPSAGLGRVFLSDESQDLAQRQFSEPAALEWRVAGK